MHVNTRSLTKNVEKLEEFIEQLEKLPEIIAFSETKLKETSSISLDEY